MMNAQMDDDDDAERMNMIVVVVVRWMRFAPKSMTIGAMMMMVDMLRESVWQTA